jgi:hypothetical protein
MRDKHKAWFDRMPGVEICRRIAFEWCQLGIEERSVYKTISARSVEYFQKDLSSTGQVSHHFSASDFIKRERELIPEIQTSMSTPTVPIHLPPSTEERKTKPPAPSSPRRPPATRSAARSGKTTRKS